MGFFFFVILPLTELYLLTLLWEQIGFLQLVALLVASAAIGVAITRQQGLRVWRDYQQALVSGVPQAEGALEGVLVLLGGALLIAPGPLSDLIGLFLLVPWTRRWVARWLVRRNAPVGGGSFFVSRTFVVRPPSGGRYEEDHGGNSGVIDTTGEAADDVPPRQLP
ncbi:MAG TPA: FxsA family protein [Polyangiaceae bacterium]|nr:FxsA family protein [Polyangiaceae bacterium]